MFKLSFSSTVALAAVAIGGLVACGSLSTTSQNEIVELDFGILSTETQASQKPLWEPFVEAIGQCVGLPVNAVYATQYSGLIEAMRFGDLELAWYGGKSYIEAARIAGAEAFAQTVSADGSRGYYGHLITYKDHPMLEEIDLEAQNGDEYVIANASELAFAFIDPNSTSGFLVPSYYVFGQNGVNPNTAFENLIFAGNHEAATLSVANAHLDVAATNSEALQRIALANPEILEKIQIIWTSPIIPGEPIAYRQDLPEDLKATIRTCFHNFDDPSILNPLQWSALEPADDSRWDTIRELDLAKQILEVENSATREEVKARQLAELNAELEALGQK
ncbi:phosphonate ABC transporter substrate-binding protein [Synechococcus sp. PCC 7336]|uniref:phosphonate ABC transporter substrate-binding protein n=1 Tax=Synechococcus sp. PCC 7336 TaxID=195250 RepID=UPI00034D6C7E|nr:phosphonate ABC transporter substrate-binding protein [Synechococcus sp. PCC 7336]